MAVRPSGAATFPRAGEDRVGACKTDPVAPRRRGRPHAGDGGVAVAPFAAELAAVAPKAPKLAPREVAHDRPVRWASHKARRAPTRPPASAASEQDQHDAAPGPDGAPEHHQPPRVPPELYRRRPLHLEEGHLGHGRRAAAETLAVRLSARAAMLPAPQRPVVTEAGGADPVTGFPRAPAHGNGDDQR